MRGLQNSTKKKNKIYSKFVKCKNEQLKDFFKVITRPIEISCPRSLKGQKKNISLSFLLKTLKMLRRVG